MTKSDYFAKQVILSSTNYKYTFIIRNKDLVSSSELSSI